MTTNPCGRDGKRRGCATGHDDAVNRQVKAATAAHEITIRMPPGGSSVKCGESASNPRI